MSMTNAPPPATTALAPCKCGSGEDGGDFPWLHPVDASGEHVSEYSHTRAAGWRVECNYVYCLSKTATYPTEGEAAAEWNAKMKVAKHV